MSYTKRASRRAVVTRGSYVAGWLHVSPNAASYWLRRGPRQPRLLSCATSQAPRSPSAERTASPGQKKQKEEKIIAREKEKGNQVASAVSRGLRTFAHVADGLEPARSEAVTPLRLR
eukprot:scaffold4855_cov261-Pinguiococcus_pyrenoidosus.AAC.3